jgi:hypothetical protein
MGSPQPQVTSKSPTNNAGVHRVWVAMRLSFDVITYIQKKPTRRLSPAACNYPVTSGKNLHIGGKK